MKRLICIPTITAASLFAIASNTCMDRSQQCARNPFVRSASLKEVNGAITQRAQERFSLLTQVKRELSFTGDCKIDLNRIILYLNRIAEEYNHKSTRAYYHMLMAQTALERLDACITRYCEGEEHPASARSFTETNRQRCHFIEQHAGKSWHELFINALTTLELIPPC